jgi:hypothetical protein
VNWIFGHEKKVAGNIGRSSRSYKEYEEFKKRSQEPESRSQEERISETANGRNGDGMDSGRAPCPGGTD